MEDLDFVLKGGGSFLPTLNFVPAGLNGPMMKYFVNVYLGIFFPWKLLLENRNIVCTLFSIRKTC